MKKILLSMLVMSVFAVASAQDTTVTRSTTITRTDTTTHRYYYYPGSNVYYDEISGNYWYYEKPSSRWTTVQTLPSTITVDNKSRYRINYQGDEPWKQNSMHMKKYKVKKGGKVKMKPAKTQ